VSEDEIISLFLQADEDNNGSISMEEFNNVIDPDGPNFDQDSENILDYDTDGDGLINMQEFTNQINALAESNPA
jgi:Ca2+-binding EF-hand superfamily protein